jgi:hypothetical protein
MERIVGRWRHVQAVVDGLLRLSRTLLAGAILIGLRELNLLLRPLKNKSLKEENTTKTGLYNIPNFTTPKSNKSQWRNSR